METVKMTQEQLDAMIDKRVEEKIKAGEAERKSAIRVAMQEAADDVAKKNFSKGYGNENPIDTFGSLVSIGARNEFDAEKMMHAIEKAEKGGGFEVSPMTKALVAKTLEAGVPSSGGFTVPQVLTSKVIDYLYAYTLLDKMGVPKFPMPNGNVRLARLNTPATVGWVGEATSDGKTQEVFDDVVLNAKKAKALVPISNSLLRFTSVDLNGWIARDLRTKLQILLDTGLFYGTGTACQPLGLTNVTGIQTEGSSSTALALGTPQDLIGLLKQANVQMNNVKWVMSPMMESWLMKKTDSVGHFVWRDEMIGGKLNGYPYFVSSTISYTDTTTDYADLWVADWDQFVYGVGLDMELAISKEGSYTVSSTTYNAFERDETLIRVISEVDFGVMQPKAFVKSIHSVA